MHQNLFKNSGQSRAIISLFKIADSGRIPHAFLFSGNKGTGKFFLAKKFIEYITDSYSPEKLSKVKKLEEPFVKYVFPLPRGKGETNNDSPTQKLSPGQLTEINDQIKIKIDNPFYKLRIDGANNIKISSIRDIKKFLSIEFSDIKYRFVIIEDADLMNSEAQNALLKSLEEPPEGVIFLLITSYKDNLLPTIHSRCWQVNVPPLSENEVATILVNSFNIEEELAHKVSGFSNGSIDYALNLIEREIEPILDDVISILRYSLGGRFLTAFKFFETALKNGDKELIKIYFDLILKWLSEAERLKYLEETEVNEFDIKFIKYKETIEKFNQRFSRADIPGLINELNDLIILSDKNVSLNLLILNIIFKLSSIDKR